MVWIDSPAPSPSSLAVPWAIDLVAPVIPCNSSLWMIADLPWAFSFQELISQEPLRAAFSPPCRVFHAHSDFLRLFLSALLPAVATSCQSWVLLESAELPTLAVLAPFGLVSPSGTWLDHTDMFDWELFWFAASCWVAQPFVWSIDSPVSLSSWCQQSWLAGFLKLHTHVPIRLASRSSSFANSAWNLMIPSNSFPMSCWNSASASRLLAFWMIALILNGALPSFLDLFVLFQEVYLPHILPGRSTRSPGSEASSKSSTWAWKYKHSYQVAVGSSPLATFYYLCIPSSSCHTNGRHWRTPWVPLPWSSYSRVAYSPSSSAPRSALPWPVAQPISSSLSIPSTSSGHRRTSSATPLSIDCDTA